MASTSFLTRKQKATSGIRDNRQEALPGLTNKYMEVMDVTIRSKPAELAATNMTDGQDPDECLLRATLLRSQVEHISNRRFKDIMVQVLTTNYKEGEMMTCRDSQFGS